MNQKNEDNFVVSDSNVEKTSSISSEPPFKTTSSTTTSNFDEQLYSDHTKWIEEEEKDESSDSIEFIDKSKQKKEEE